MASTVGLGLFAGITESNQFVVPAIACAAYTAASTNNAFDNDIHGLIGFLDSPVSPFNFTPSIWFSRFLTLLFLLFFQCAITVIMVILIMTLVTAPANVMTLLALAVDTLPFLVDFGLSAGDTYRRISNGG